MKTRTGTAWITTLILAALVVPGCGGGDGNGDPTGTIPAPQPGPTVVELRPTASSYRIGEAVTIDVMIRDGRDVGSVPFHLHYDPSVVTFLPPAQEGPFLSADGTATVFLAADLSGDELVVGMSRLGGTVGAEGSGALATIEFMAVGAGDCGFRFSSASVKDPQARTLPADFNAGAVAVAP